jgi:hypothetical protein
MQYDALDPVQFCFARVVKAPRLPPTALAVHRPSVRDIDLCYGFQDQIDKHKSNLRLLLRKGQLLSRYLLHCPGLSVVLRIGSVPFVNTFFKGLMSKEFSGLPRNYQVQIMIQETTRV